VDDATVKLLIRPPLSGRGGQESRRPAREITLPFILPGHLTSQAGGERHFPHDVPAGAPAPRRALAAAELRVRRLHLRCRRDVPWPPGPSVARVGRAA